MGSDRGIPAVPLCVTPLAETPATLTKSKSTLL